MGARPEYWPGGQICVKKDSLKYLTEEHLEHKERAPEHEAQEDVDEEEHEAPVPYSRVNT